MKNNNVVKLITFLLLTTVPPLYASGKGLLHQTEPGNKTAEQIDYSSVPQLIPLEKERFDNHYKEKSFHLIHRKKLQRLPSLEETVKKPGEKFLNHKDNPGNGIFIDLAVKEFPIINEPLNKNVLHLFTHGRPGELWLEKKWRNPVQIADWLKSTDLLRRKSHLNIYGCEFAKGEKGKRAASYLQEILGVRVAASDDLTGRDGDWNLEWGVQNNALSFSAYPHNLQCATSERGNKIVTGSHSVILRTPSGFIIWGARADSDGVTNLANPEAITPANGYNYTGTPLMADSATEFTLDRKSVV